MIYNFTCTLKGHTFPYKTEADSLTEAMIKIREHIKNAVEMELVVPEPPINKATSNFINFFNETINKK
jgi:predicted small metal-binding protein